MKRIIRVTLKMCLLPFVVFYFILLGVTIMLESFWHWINNKEDDLLKTYLEFTRETFEWMVE